MWWKGIVEPGYERFSQSAKSSFPPRIIESLNFRAQEVFHDLEFI
ncbi:MAG: hypothetical protein QOF48_3847 [Verrucomicrobiota bacterium]|jgi:hypothetical protein